MLSFQLFSIGISDARKDRCVSSLKNSLRQIPSLQVIEQILQENEIVIPVSNHLPMNIGLIESYVKQLMMSTTKQFTIAVEGNIGSGKSTVLTHLGKSPVCDIVAEPVENWTNLRGNNILAMLYQDPHRWGFAFQSNAQMSLAKMHAVPSKAAIKVMERSIYSARYCFVENLYRNKILQNVEYEILHNWFEYLTSNDACHLDLIIYLRAKPETCLERIRTRNRPEEQSITLDYLKQLHERHEDWLSSLVHTSVLVVDADQTKENVYTDTNSHLMNLVPC